jgi:hypothetical protein
MDPKNAKNSPPEQIGGPPLGGEQKGVASALPTSFPVWQSQLAERLGVSLWDLRELRDQHLVREVDFTIGENNHVVLTEAAAQKLTALVMASRDTSAPPVTLPEAALRSSDVKLKVQRSWPLIPNPRLVEAALAVADGHHEAGKVVLVRVRDNRAWKRGDELTARHFEGIVYDLTSRAPKRRV